MNCVYENCLYIYNIKLIEKNTLLIKKKLSNMFFILLTLKKKNLTQSNMFVLV